MHIQTETEMTDLTKLAPCEVWTEFEAITRVPRPSKKEEKIRDYLVGWAKEHGLEYRCDATGNVVIRKPATTGYEAISYTHLTLPTT